MKASPIYEVCRRDDQWSVYCTETNTFAYVGASERFCLRKARQLNARTRRRPQQEGCPRCLFATSKANPLR